MYPTLVRFGDFQVTTFGVLVAIGALAGLWMFHRELARSGLPANGVDAALVGVLGGLAGAKIVWAIEFRRRGTVSLVAPEPRRAELVRRIPGRRRRWFVVAAPAAHPYRACARGRCAGAGDWACHRANRLLSGG